MRGWRACLSPGNRKRDHGRVRDATLHRPGVQEQHSCDRCRGRQHGTVTGDDPPVQQTDKTILPHLAVSTEERAGNLIEACVTRGTAHLRTHVDIDLESRLLKLEGRCGSSGSVPPYAASTAAPSASCRAYDHRRGQAAPDRRRYRGSARGLTGMPQRPRRWSRYARRRCRYRRGARRRGGNGSGGRRAP